MYGHRELLLIKGGLVTPNGLLGRGGLNCDKLKRGMGRTIVKTRQPDELLAGPTKPSDIDTTGSAAVETPRRSRGVLRLPSQGVSVLRRNPDLRLAPFVAYYWRVSWDLRGRATHLQETLPHPNIYLVFEKDRLQLSGVTTTKFIRLLEGQASVFGVKFKPGGFRPFSPSAVSLLTDRVVPATDIFGRPAEDLEATLRACPGEEAMLQAVERFLLSRLPKLDENVVLVDSIVEQVLRKRQIKTVDELANVAGVSKRSLQRLFREYVGISPKWVIQRYRLHELVERLEAGDALNWADLAVELGYFDQAHLIHDFRTITGYSPAGYQRR